ncbi:hypothetical protein ACJRO7_010160 [Eucalyptus globulus]|uniref:Uncharacterized protein n=1 Tax=Eucalyptus globulus TaxID=34317 RepID=A0ABD3LEP2_EUCGL
MNAFKTHKACLPIPWSPNLYITLVRSIPGTRRPHQWNIPTVRGMLRQEMFKACKEEEANHRALCLPVVISHLPAPDCSSYKQTLSS